MNDNNQANTLSDGEVIDLFIEGLMEEKHINAPTEEIRQKVFNDLKNQLLTEIDRSLIAELPDDKLEELNRAAATTGQLDPVAVADAIKAANLDVTEITGITMQRFRDLQLGQTPETAGVSASSKTQTATGKTEA